MNKLKKVLNELSYAAEVYSELLMKDKCTCIHAKRRLVSELCMDINSFVMTGIDTFLYVYPCTQAIRQLNLATNKQQVVEACLFLLKWTAEEIHNLEDEHNV